MINFDKDGTPLMVLKSGTTILNVKQRKERHKTFWEIMGEVLELYKQLEEEESI